MRLLRALGSCLIAMLLLQPTAASAGQVTHRDVKRIVPGMVLERLRMTPGPVRVFVLEVRPGKGLTADVALGGRALPVYGRTVPEIARSAGAIAAINGDFGGFRPAHAFAQDGDLVQTPIRHGDVVAFSSDGRRVYIGHPRVRVAARAPSGSTFPIARWNSGSPSHGELAAFTPEGGILESPPSGACSVQLTPHSRGWSRDGTRVRLTAVADAPRCGREPVAVAGGIVLAARRGSNASGWLSNLSAGDRVAVSWTSGWVGVADMQGGFPMLVDRGRMAIRQRCRSDFCRLQPRTGIGASVGCFREASTACVIEYVVVDGRRAGWSSGLRLLDFARLFRRLGAWKALNLDGGGSSTMVVRGNVVNRPAEGLRAVPSAFTVRIGPDPGQRDLGVPTPAVHPWSIFLRLSLAHGSV